MSTTVHGCGSGEAGDRALDGSVGARAKQRRALVGELAPEFELRDAEARPVRLSELVARGPVVVFFYPGDFSPACIVEACAFRNWGQMFAEAGASVVGISGDGARRHGAFSRALGLAFPLLSDQDGAVRAAYGVKRTLGIMPGRVTVVIDRGGVVRMVYRSQLRPREHVRRALGAVRGLTDERSKAPRSSPAPGPRADRP